LGTLETRIYFANSVHDGNLWLISVALMVNRLKLGLGRLICNTDENKPACQAVHNIRQCRVEIGITVSWVTDTMVYQNLLIGDDYLLNINTQKCMANYAKNLHLTPYLLASTTGMTDGRAWTKLLL
jgi:hypothetical protein